MGGGGDLEAQQGRPEAAAARGRGGGGEDGGDGDDDGGGHDDDDDDRLGDGGSMRALAEELRGILRERHDGRRQALWKHGQDARDGLRELVTSWWGVASLVAAALFLADGATCEPGSSSACSATIAQGCLVLASIVLVALAHYASLERFRQEKLIRIERIISGLKKAKEPTMSSWKFVRQYDSQLPSLVYTFRRSYWIPVPSNLLMKGDVVALMGGSPAPVAARRIYPRDGACFGPGEIVTKTPSALARATAALPEAFQAANQAAGADGLSLCTVLETPMVETVRAAIQEAHRVKYREAPHMLPLRRKHAKQYVLHAIIFFVLVSLIANIVRYVYRPDGMGAVHLILGRLAIVLTAGIPILLPVWEQVLEQWAIAKLIGLSERLQEMRSYVSSVSARVDKDERRTLKTKIGVTARQDVRLGRIAHLFWQLVKPLRDNQSFERSLGSAASFEMANMLQLPLKSGKLLETLSRVTALCCLDEQVVLDPTPSVEEIMLLQGESSATIVDLCDGPNNTVAFEGPAWKRHLTSLKPLALACLLGTDSRLQGNLRQRPTAMRRALQAAGSPPCLESTASLEDLASQLHRRAIPRHLRALAHAIGFRSSDSRHYAPCELVRLTDDLPVPMEMSRSVLTWTLHRGRAQMTCIIVEDRTLAPAQSPAAASSMLPPPASAGTLPTMDSFDEVDQETLQEEETPEEGHAADSAAGAKVKEARNAGDATFPRKFRRTSAGKTGLDPYVRGIEPASSLPAPSGSGAAPETSDARTIDGSAAQTEASASKASASRPGAATAGTSPNPMASSRRKHRKRGDEAGSRSLHMFTFGDPALVSSCCIEHWSGEAIWPLTTQSRSAIFSVERQWKSEDFDAVAFAYTPVPSHLATRFPAQTPANLQPLHVHLAETEGPPPDLAPSPTATISTAATTTNGHSHGQAAALGAVAAASAAQQGKARVHFAKRNSHAPAAAAATQSSLAGGAPAPATGGRSLAPGPDAAARMLQVEKTTILKQLLPSQVFTGMVGSREKPRASLTGLIEDLDAAGIRFVYFSPRGPRRSLVVADKMGLETDWNTAISLRRLETDEGLDTPDDHRFRADWDVNAKLPHGIEEIRKHIVEIDDVPLRVSTFTDSTPQSSREMIGILQDNGEIVAVVGTGMCADNQHTFRKANLAVSLQPKILLRHPGSHKQFLSTSNLVGPDAKDGRAAVRAAQPALSQLEISSAITSLHSSIILQSDASLSIVGDLIWEARLLTANYQQALIFIVAGHILLSGSTALSYVFALPDLLSPIELTWYLWVQVPLLGLPLLSTRRMRSFMHELPAKNDPEHIKYLSALGRRYANYVFVRLTPSGVVIVLSFMWVLAEMSPDPAQAWSSFAWGADADLGLDSDDVQVLRCSMGFLMWWFLLVHAVTFFYRHDSIVGQVLLNHAWFPCALVSLALQMVYATLSLYLNTDDTVSPIAWLSEVPAVFWVPFTCWPVFIVAVAEVSKRTERKLHARNQRRLRVFFDTRLGMYSPK